MRLWRHKQDIFVRFKKANHPNLVSMLDVMDAGDYHIGWVRKDDRGTWACGLPWSVFPIRRGFRSKEEAGRFICGAYWRTPLKDIPQGYKEPYKIL